MDRYYSWARRNFVGLIQKNCLLTVYLYKTIMKNIAGKIIGFIIGMAGFLFLFKVFVLDKMPPSDELAPGIVLIISVLSGLLFGFAGNLVQNYLRKSKI